MLASFVLAQQCLSQLVFSMMFPVIAFKRGGQIRVFILQIMNWGVGDTLAIIIVIAILGHVMAAHARFHFDHLLWRDAQVISHRTDLFAAEPA